MNDSSSFIAPQSEVTVPLILCHSDDYEQWLSEQVVTTQNWLSNNGFKAKAGAWSLFPGADGGLLGCILVYEGLDVWTISGLPSKLPEAVYALQMEADEETRYQLVLGWGLGSYRYTRYISSDEPSSLPRLVVESDALRERLDAQVASVSLVRDLVNTPPQDMMPEQLSETARTLAQQYEAHFEEVVGDSLLVQNYPAIHAVGRASEHSPRLIEMLWGDEAAPRLTLIGKGVCFDSGGLDIKPASAMRLMKKDMGGAAHALGLAQMIMAAGLPVRLHVLIPAVENAISGDAFRPGDVLQSRKGLSIEIDNTDAEGRLVLCDALTRAAEESPDLIIDFATLTGAARVALGTELPALFTDNNQLARDLEEKACDWDDRVWRLPLHEAYREQIDSKIADIVNCSSGSFGGAITAALFLKAFVEEGQDWMHFDLMAWNQRARPGRPEGGEAMGLLGLFALLQERYA